MPLQNLAGIEAYVQTFEGGARKALAIHCSLAHSGAWAGLAAQLQPDATLTAFDLPGHGKTTDWDGKCDLHDLSTDMAGELLTGSMDLIGHSFGATVALRLAARHPEKIRSLTLIEPVLFAATRLAAPTVFASLKAEADIMVRVMDRAGPEAATRSFVTAWGDGRPWETLPAPLRQYMQERMFFIAASGKALYDDSRGILADGALNRVDMPVLIAQGGASNPAMDAICASLASRLPSAKRLVVKGAGHMLPITHPAVIAKEVRALFACSNSGAT